MYGTQGVPVKGFETVPGTRDKVDVVDMKGKSHTAGHQLGFDICAIKEGALAPIQHRLSKFLQSAGCQKVKVMGSDGKEVELEGVYYIEPKTRIPAMLKPAARIYAAPYQLTNIFVG